MVVININDQVISFQQMRNPGEAGFLAGIHNDQPAGFRVINHVRVSHIEQVAHGVDEKIPQVFLLGPGKDDHCAGV